MIKVVFLVVLPGFWALAVIHGVVTPPEFIITVFTIVTQKLAERSNLL